MAENLPSPINSNNDLDIYESYLKNSNYLNEANIDYPMSIVNNNNMSYIPQQNQNISERLKNTAYMPAFLAKHIGKLVRVEFYLGNQLVTRMGILMTVGDGFIVLRSQNNCTLLCDAKSIRFVTIIHDNDLRSLINNY